MSDFKDFIFFIALASISSCSFLSKKTVALNESNTRKPSSLHAFSDHKASRTNQAFVRSKLKRFPFGQAVLKSNGRPECVLDVTKNPQFLPPFATPAKRVRKKINLPSCDVRQAGFIQQTAKTAFLVYDKGPKVAVLHFAVMTGIVCVLTGAVTAELAFSKDLKEDKMYSWTEGTVAGIAGLVAGGLSGGAVNIVCGFGGNFLGRKGYSGVFLLDEVMSGVMKAANWTKGKMVEYIHENPTEKP